MIFSTAAVLLAAWGLAVGAMAADKGDVAIRVEGLRNDQGHVLVTLSRQVPGEIVKGVNLEEIVYAEAKESLKGDISFIAQEIPDGTFYLYLFHDENGNKVLDYDGRIPAEGFACYPGKQGIPEVRIAGGNVEANVVMVYMNDLIKK